MKISEYQAPEWLISVLEAIQDKIDGFVAYSAQADTNFVHIMAVIIIIALFTGFLLLLAKIITYMSQYDPPHRDDEYSLPDNEYPHRKFTIREEP